MFHVIDRRLLCWCVCLWIDLDWGCSALQATFEAAPWEITLEEMSLLLIRDLLVSFD